MRHISVEPPPFFHRGPSPLARLAFFGVLSIALLFADTRYRYLEGIRQVAAIVLYPLQRAVQLPGEALAWFGDYFASKRALADENAALKQDLVAHAPSTQGFARLQRRERAAARAARDRGALSRASATAVEVLYTGRDPFTQKLFVNRGTDAGIRAGRGGHRRRGRRRAGDARVPEHGGGDARHRQGPRGAGARRAQRRAQRVLRRRRRPLAGASLHGADGRHPAGRPPRDRPASTARIRRAWPSRRSTPSTATPGRCSRASPCAPLAGVDRSTHPAGARAGRGAAAAAGGARRRRRREEGRARQGAPGRLTRCARRGAASRPAGSA